MPVNVSPAPVVFLTFVLFSILIVLTDPSVAMTVISPDPLVIITFTS